MAKASNQNGFDSEGRKPGDRSGLDRPFEKRPGKTPKCSTAEAALHGTKVTDNASMIDNHLYYRRDE